VTDPLSDPEFVSGLRPVPSTLGGAGPSWPAADLSGVRPDGTPVIVDLAACSRPVLLVFLALGCDGCAQFWEGLTDPPTGADVVVVTKGPGAVDADDVGARSRGAPAVPVVMSDMAWSDYRVTGYPFLVLVEPATRRIIGESVGFGWSDAADLVATGRRDGHR